MRPSRLAVVLFLVLSFGTGIGSAAPARQPIAVELHRGQVVRLPSPATTVFIADPTIADVQVKSPTLVYLFGKAPGETTLIAADADERILLETTVRVSHNLERLRAGLEELLPGNGVTVSTAADSLVLEGSVATPREAEDVRRLALTAVGDETKLINRLSVSSSTQINLRVRIAEMSREVTKILGVSLNPAQVNIGDFAFRAITGNPFARTVALGGGSRVVAGGSDINGIIDALENDHLVRILAEPNLTALSGQTASFLAGGEFPILIPQDETRVLIEFKPFGVSLSFTPTVLGDGRISLQVRPEVSELSSTGAVTLGDITVPALTTRRAETTVELASGQSFAIAGLLRNDGSQTVARVPGLGDLPIIGALFRSSEFQRNETELVIIVTPYSVNPVSDRRLAAPTDGLLAPHDIDRVLFGAQWRRQNARSAASPGLAGPVGFELD